MTGPIDVEGNVLNARIADLEQQVRLLIEVATKSSDLAIKQGNNMLTILDKVITLEAQAHSHNVQ